MPADHKDGNPSDGPQLPFLDVKSVIIIMSSP